MPPTIPDLWPSLGDTPQTPPVAILRQQGIFLGQKTANQVYGEVLTKALPDHNSFSHVLWVVAPFLGYRQPIVAAVHDVNFYPVQIGPAKEMPPPPGFIVPRPITVAKTPEEFMHAVQGMLASEETVKLLNALIVQSNEPAA